MLTFRTLIMTSNDGSSKSTPGSYLAMHRWWDTLDIENASSCSHKLTQSTEKLNAPPLLVDPMRNIRVHISSGRSWISNRTSNTDCRTLRIIWLINCTCLSQGCSNFLINVDFDEHVAYYIVGWLKWNDTVLTSANARWDEVHRWKLAIQEVEIIIHGNSYTYHRLHSAPHRIGCAAEYCCSRQLLTLRMAMPISPSFLPSLFH